MVWDRPVEPGIYAVCIKVREFRRGYDNPEDSVFMSTTHRAMMIDIDESMLVSTAAPFLKGLFSLFPNPASAVVFLQFGAMPGPTAEVRMYDIMGRAVYTQSVKEAGQYRRLEVPVAGWPPGVYVAEVRSAGQVSVEKFVIRAE